MADKPTDEEMEKRLKALELEAVKRKRAEASLKKREATLASIFRAAPIGIGLVADRTLLQVNDLMCSMLGYASDDLIGKSARILYPSDEEFEWVGEEKYAQIRERGTGTVETRWRRKDGEVIDVLLSSTPLDQSDLSAGVTFTSLDITERKLAERALRESEERYRRITEAVTDYIYTVTVQDGGSIHTVHGPGCVAVTGYMPENFSDDPSLWIRMVHEKDRNAVGTHAAQVLSGVKVAPIEHRIVRQDGVVPRRAQPPVPCPRRLSVPGRAQRRPHRRTPLPNRDPALHNPRARPAPGQTVGAGHPQARTSPGNAGDTATEWSGRVRLDPAGRGHGAL